MKIQIVNQLRDNEGTLIFFQQVLQEDWEASRLTMIPNDVERLMYSVKGILNEGVLLKLLKVRYI
jgi:hypothetical protein